MPNLYIIAGCNGAGKTTASFTILPEILNCREFVNADSIAAGLSPFNPESVAMKAGKLMLQRIDQLIREEADFAFETPVCDNWMVINNLGSDPELIANGTNKGEKTIINTNISELSDNILSGVKKAVKKLIKLNAANDEDMVVGNKDGSFKIVPAKELLKEL